MLAARALIALQLVLVVVGQLPPTTGAEDASGEVCAQMGAPMPLSLAGCDEPTGRVVFAIASHAIAILPDARTHAKPPLYAVRRGHAFISG
jgi:hypothetical protein